MTLEYFLDERYKKTKLEKAINKILFMKNSKVICEDYLFLLENNDNFMPVINNYILDRIIILLSAELENNIRNLVIKFLKERGYNNKFLLECILKDLDLRSLIYKQLKGNISKFVNNTLMNFLEIDNFDNDKWKENFEKNFIKNSSMIFSDFEDKRDDYIKNIWNSILREERNKIAHQIYHYPHVDYYIFYTVFMADMFLLTLKNSLYELAK